MAPARCPPFHLNAKQNLVLISLNRCGMVGFGIGASLEGGESNLESKKSTSILSNHNDLVDILSSGMERPWRLNHQCDFDDATPESMIGYNS